MSEVFDATPADPHCARCGKRWSDHLYYGDPREGELGLCDREGGGLFRRADADMPRLGTAPHPDVPLGAYRHYKGGEYEVIGGSLLVGGASEFPLVLYRSIEQGYCAARTVADFTATVGDRRRFERIGKGA
jgi:hypothetical protein